MKQSLASVRFLFFDVLKKEIDFDFFVKMKKSSENARIIFFSEKLLSLLHEYFKEYKLKVYLFEKDIALLIIFSFYISQSSPPFH